MGRRVDLGQRALNANLILGAGTVAPVSIITDLPEAVVDRSQVGHGVDHG